MAPANERMKIYRKRMKEDEHQYAEYLEKERERSKKRRENIKKLPNAEKREQILQSQREKAKKRVRLYRARAKKQLQVGEGEIPPTDPSTAAQSEDHLSKLEQKRCVEGFFLRSDVSQIAQAKGDVISLMELTTGKMRQWRKRYMSITLKEAYEYFKVIHPSTLITKSSFYALKPQYVFVISEIPHNIYNTFTVTEF